MTAVVASTLSGCVGTPALIVYGGLTDLCFETQTTDEGFLAYVSVTIENSSPREVILRQARPVELVNAEVTDVSVIVTDSPYTTFGVAPGGRLNPPQRIIWNDRTPLNGAKVPAHGSAELVVELRARDYTAYSGLKGLSVTYDDGWFSASSVGQAVVGFVPPWTSCTKSAP